MLSRIFKITLFCLVFIFLLNYTLAWAANPSSTNYKIQEYSFGAGGTASSSSTNYSVMGVLGETGQGSASSALYNVGDGLVFGTNSNVPGAPTFTNPDNYYNKLKLVINIGSNPTDTEYAITISTDRFATVTRYVQNDNTIANNLNDDDWQTYASWGGASGFNIIGLTPGTEYTVKIAARHGQFFSQTRWGPTALASTISPTLTFDIDVASSDTETSPPFTVDIGQLTAATVVTASNKVWVDVGTNGTTGANVYLYGENSGLSSSNVSYTISTVNGNLSSVSEGYGAQSSSATQTSGGPMEAVSPYDGATSVVGPIDTTKRIIFDSSNLPVNGGRASFAIKAKSSSVTRAAADYTDTLTVIVSASY